MTGVDDVYRSFYKIHKKRLEPRTGKKRHSISIQKNHESTTQKNTLANERILVVEKEDFQYDAQ